MIDSITIPTYITLLRLCLAPLILPFAFVIFLPYNNFVLNCFLAFLFLLFSITDFLDGFLARYYDQTSRLGTILDPIADKFLIFSSLIGLLAAQKIFFLWVLIFIGRDLFLMGLRHVGAQYNITVSVSWWGKTKTVVLMAYIAYVIVFPYRDFSYFNAVWWYTGEFTLLGASLFLSLWSAKEYAQQFLKKLTSQQ